MGFRLMSSDSNPHPRGSRYYCIQSAVCMVNWRTSYRGWC